MAPRIFIAFALLAATLAPARAQPFVKVNVGLTNSATDVGFFIAHKKNYYRDEGIDAQFIVFDSAAKMIAPLASGDLDVAAGGISAGLYNAVARGIDIRMVADKNSTPPGRASTKLLIRKDLIDSGRYKSLPDIKGLKLANSAPGGSGDGTLKKLLDRAGLKWGDEVVAILTEYSLIKDPAVHRSFVQSAIHPDGRLDPVSMKSDFDIFREIGLIQGDVTVEKAVDTSFLDAAVRQLGPYRPAAR